MATVTVPRKRRSSCRSRFATCSRRPVTQSLQLRERTAGAVALAPRYGAALDRR
jgi:hypothetical protein